jgi:putative hydrolase of the HAD superfamily
MSPLPRLVLFDLMGTLLEAADERVPYWEKIGAFLEQEGRTDARKFASDYSEWRRNRTPSRVELVLRDRIEMFAPASEEQHRSIEREFLEDYAQRTRVIDGVESMLQSWAGVAKLGVVSNFFVAGVPRELLHRHGLLHHFEFVVDSGQVGIRKPSAEIFERALAEASVDLRQPSDVLMIGDDWEADVEGARGMGFRVAHFSDGVLSGGEHVPIVRSWHDFRPAA